MVVGGSIHRSARTKSAHKAYSPINTTKTPAAIARTQRPRLIAMLVTNLARPMVSGDLDHVLGLS
jgi:hypothetical protein